MRLSLSLSSFVVGVVAVADVGLVVVVMVAGVVVVAALVALAAVVVVVCWRLQSESGWPWCVFAVYCVVVVYVLGRVEV
mgnify:CR=1 FL=1